MESLINVLRFTVHILLPKYPLTLLPFISTYVSTLYLIHKCKNKRKHVLSIVPEDVHTKLVDQYFKCDQKPIGDVDTCILVPVALLDKLQPLSGSVWLKLTNYVKNQQTVSTHSCIVQALGVPDIRDSTVIITETSHFNIKRKLKLDEKNEVVIDTLSFEGFNSSGCNPSFMPSIATKVSIGLIRSSIEVDNAVIDVVLGSYFETPRYVCIGDILSIDVFKYVPHLNFSAHLHNKTLFFEVLAVEGPSYKSLRPASVHCGYFIIRNLTTMLQSVDQQGYLPPRCSTCAHSDTLTARNYTSFLLKKCPSGLDSFFDELLISFRPFLHYDCLKMHGVRPVFLVCGPRGVGKRKVLRCVADTLGINVWNVDCLDLKGTTPGYTEKKIKIIFKKVQEFVPCILHLRNIDVLCQDHDGNEDSRVIIAFLDEISNLYNRKSASNKYPVFLVGTCSNASSNDTSAIAPGLARAFIHVVRFTGPNESQRVTLLEWIAKKNNIKLHDNVSIIQIAARSSGFLYEDLKTLVLHAARIRYKHCKKGIVECGAETFLDDSLQQTDFEEGLELMQSAYSGAIGAPKIPAVSWNDIGGLLPLKEEIKRTITMPLQHPELIASGLRRSGILLYGPPGTGKTLLAKAVATECSLNFLSVKGPELLNMYVGQSEENVREVFERARAASPCIIFFDELDSLAPNRGRSGDSAGVMDRVVSQLLAEMDGIQKSTHLYVIGATNRPDLIDPALLRPGRFDKLLYVGVCEDHEAQLSVMTALTRKFHTGSDVDMHDIVSSLPSNLTGADLFSVCSNAWLNAAKKTIHALEKGESERSNLSTPVIVNTRDFQTAIKELAPSVTAEDLAYFRQLHQKLAIK